ncbi:beta-propeller fold lactonase family protein [Streptomyces canus]|uniref:beta-propeller fold lactonase family protein n=1 Tax=Streptomyces canus TaxID=58343 RepID=UPI003F6CCBC4
MARRRPCQRPPASRWPTHRGPGRRRPSGPSPPPAWPIRATRRGLLRVDDRAAAVGRALARDGRHYESGSVTVHPIDSSGALGERRDAVTPSSPAPGPGQEGPHAHQFRSEPGGSGPTNRRKSP